ncbi:MAG: hypothetical protein KAS12_04690 [Candidatus Aenigmarchaeota archaeon]|nr:hypothetical protein [Candidatus Aenigmarchaeota archaeon]
MPTCLTDNPSNRRPRQYSPWVCPTTTVSCKHGFIPQTIERSSSNGPKSCVGDFFKKVKRKRLVCVPDMKDKKYYKTDFDTLSECCTSTAGGIQCKPGYCSGTNLCNNFMKTSCAKVISGKPRLVTDKNCKFWANSHPDFVNPLMENYCKGSTNGKSRLLSDPECATWCRNNVEKCDGTKITYCRAHPNSVECSCFNAKRQKEYLDLIGQDKTGILQQFSPFCVYSGCKGTTDLYDTLHTSDMKNIISSCPVGDVNMSIIDVSNSSDVIISDVTQSIDTGTTAGPAVSTVPVITTTNEFKLPGGLSQKMIFFIIIFIIVVAIAIVITMSGSGEKNIDDEAPWWEL